jgi:ketosteroid isomerase-like protein
MSEENENIQTVRAMYDAFNRGDWQAVLAHVSPDIEFETDPRHPEAGIYRGRQQFRRLWEGIEAPFERTVVEPEKFFTKGPQVIAFVTMRRRPAGGHEDFSIRIGELWTLRDGKLVRGQAFAHRSEALEAVGLSE